MLPSNQEAHYLGDIVEEIDRALSFIEGMNMPEFMNDMRTVYAVEKALQNAIEACIKIEGRKQKIDGKKVPSGRFNALIKDVDFVSIKDSANAIRHDYANVRPQSIWIELNGRMKDVRDAAEKLLNAKRTK